MHAPEARDATGRPLRGRVYIPAPVPGARTRISCSPTAATFAYPAADLDEAGALLTVRDQPDGPADDDRRARAGASPAASGERVVPDARHIQLEGGFEKGRLYQVTYTAEGAPVLGLAMAALREAVAWLKHGGAAEGNPAPRRACAGPTPTGARRPGGCCARWSTRISTSTSRGARPSTAIIANVRRRHAGRVQPALRPALEGPQPHDGAPLPVHRPAHRRIRETGAKDALHARLDARGSRLRVFYTNTSAEYHRGDASLIHTDPDGVRDAAHGPYTRVYHFAGTEHGLGIWPPTDIQTAPADPTGAGGALTEPPRRGGLLAAAARLPGEPRPLGDRGHRAAAEPPSARSPTGPRCRPIASPPPSRAFPAASYPRHTPRPRRLDW